MLFFRVVAQTNGEEYCNPHWYRWNQEELLKHYSWLQDIYPDAKFYIELDEKDITEEDFKEQYADETGIRIR